MVVVVVVVGTKGGWLFGLGENQKESLEKGRDYKSFIWIGDGRILSTGSPVW